MRVFIFEKDSKYKCCVGVETIKRKIEMIQNITGEVNVKNYKNISIYESSKDVVFQYIDMMFKDINITAKYESVDIDVILNKIKYLNKNHLAIKKKKIDKIIKNRTTKFCSKYKVKGTANRNKVFNTLLEEYKQKQKIIENIAKRKQAKKEN